MMKQLKTISKYLLIFAAALAWIFSGFPRIWESPPVPPEIQEAQALAVSNGDGILFYAASANTTPQWRTYDNATNDFSANSGTVAGAQPTINQIKTSPIKQEAIAAYQDTSGNLRVLCYNGTTWTQDWTVAVAGAGTPTTRRFDIAYETNTGDVTVAYSRNTAAVNALAYRTKLGSAGCGSANWAAAANFPTTTTVTSATVMWVKATRDGRASSNLSAWVWLDNAATNADLGAAIWSGSAFTNFKSLELSMEHVTAVGDTDNFDVQYESLSGDLMVVWGNSAGTNGVNGIRYNTCTGGTSSCTWNATALNPNTGTGDDATNLDLSADPLSDKMIFASIGNAGSDLQAMYWTGSGTWTVYANIDTATETPAAGMKLVTTGWLNNNGITKFYISYDDSTGTGISWFAATPGTTLTTTVGKQTDYASTPSINDIRSRYDTDINPFTNSEIIQTLSDSTNAIMAFRLSMNTAGNLTWSNMTTAVSLGTKPSTPQQGFSFTYWRFIPTPNITVGTTGTQTATTTIPSTNFYVGGAFTFMRDSGSANVTQIKITETDATLSADTYLSNVKIYYKQEESCSTSIPGDATVFNATGVGFSSEKATVIGDSPMAVGTSQICVYVQLNVNSGAPAGDSFDIEISNPSTEVMVSAGTVSPATAVAISGATMLQAAPATISCSTNIGSTDFGVWTDVSIKTASPNASTTMTCSNTSSGCTLYVKDAGSGSNPGLWKSASPTYLITSADATLSAGADGFGLQATSTPAGSGTLNFNSKYNKTGNDVGGLTRANTVLASSTADVANREAMVTHKAAVSSQAISGNYSDTITYECVVN